MKNLQMFLITLSMALLSGYALAQETAVEGTMLLPADAAPLPANSWIALKIENPMGGTAPLAEKLVALPEGFTGPYKYRFEKVQLSEVDTALVSAVVNVGWRPSSDGEGGWIRRGDFITEPHVQLPLPPADSTITAPDLHSTKY